LSSFSCSDGGLSRGFFRHIPPPPQLLKKWFVARISTTSLVDVSPRDQRFTGTAPPDRRRGAAALSRISVPFSAHQAIKAPTLARRWRLKKLPSAIGPYADTMLICFFFSLSSLLSQADSFLSCFGPSPGLTRFSTRSLRDKPRPIINSLPISPGTPRSTSFTPGRRARYAMPFLSDLPPLRFKAEDRPRRELFHSSPCHPFTFS